MNGHGERNIRLRIKRLAGMPARIRFLLLLAGVILAVMWIVPQTAYMATSGNGPGGVGMTGGGSTLELWLRADKGVFSDSGCSTVAADGNSVGCWQDQSGNLAHAKQQSAIGLPSYDNDTNPLNGHPVLNFVAGQVLVTDPAHLISLGALTVFTVFNAEIGNEGIVYEHNNRVATPDGSNLFTSDACTITVDRGGAETTKSLLPEWAADGEFRIVTQAYNGDHASHTIAINNAQPDFEASPCASDPGLGLPGTDTLDAPVYIGARAGGLYGIQGNIAELIFFNEDLPAVQKILVENYLSSKYNIAFDPASTNDHYDGDTPANGDFDLDVAGIGRFGGVSHDEAQGSWNGCSKRTLF
ncbi:MAG: hypothetical protein H6659_08845 [Ardenticatenaceae bacterium]|nr:hypothetical protein [Ardenticatenaceae bacterium]